MLNKVGDLVVAVAATTVTYSWVADATQFSTFAASLVGVVTAAAGAWYYIERARLERIKRKEKCSCEDEDDR